MLLLTPPKEEDSNCEERGRGRPAAEAARETRSESGKRHDGFG
jgi:hypothetical protein